MFEQFSKQEVLGLKLILKGLKSISKINKGILKAF